MPKAILEFYLPEEKEEYKDALKGASYYSALSKFKQSLRSIRKYGDDETNSMSGHEMFEKIEKIFFDFIEDLDI